MDSRAEAAYQSLISSRKYGELDPGLVLRVFKDALFRYKTVKEADKATRARLHQIVGAYLPESRLLRALEGPADAHLAGDVQALDRALMLHASTRERMGQMDALYDRVFSVTGRPDEILDLACGLNPLYLAARSLRVHGIDVHRGIIAGLNLWADRLSLPLTAELQDVCADVQYPSTDLVLVMKLLPVIEMQRPGGAMEWLRSLPAKHLLVTFPTRSLGGGGRGMERHYTDWFEPRIQPIRPIVDRFTVPGELCYIL